MNENFKNINSEITPDSEIGELFSNVEFLSKFTIFLELYLGQLQLLNVENADFKEQVDNQVNFINTNFGLLLDNDSIPDTIDVNYYFEKVLTFFNNRDNLLQFLTYLSGNPLLKRNNIKREYNKMLKIGDYLYSKFSKSVGLPKNDVKEIFENDLKKKVGEILLRENEDIMFKLSESNYPLTVDGHRIIDADFEEKIFIDGVEFLNVEYYDEYDVFKTLYIDNKGNILRLQDNVIVKKVDKIFTFGGKNFIKYIDSNNNKIMYVVSLDDYSILGSKFTDATPDSFIHNGNVFRYLITSFDSPNEDSIVENYNKLYNQDINIIDLPYLLNFINEGKIENFIDNRDFLEDFNLVEIKNIKTIDGITFLQLVVTREELIKFTINLTDNGTILSDKGDFISNIYDLEDLLGNSFLKFGKQTGLINGYLDKNFNSIKIPKHLIEEYIIKEDNVEKKSISNSLEKINQKNKSLNIDIDKILNKKNRLNKGYSNITDKIYDIKKSLLINNIQYFILNNDPKLVISEKELKEHLSHYESFSDIIDSFVIEMENNNEIKMSNGFILKQLYVKVTSNKQILFYSDDSNDPDKRINGKFMKNELNKYDNGKEIMKHIGERINSL